MKKNLLILLLLPLWLISFGQEPQLYESLAPKDETPGLYLGTSTGINNINGFLGITAEGRIVNKLTVAGGFGIGMWGYKMGIGPRFYPKYPTGVFYSLSFTTATGYNGIELPMETNRAASDTIVLNFHRANNVNLSLGYQFNIFKRGRLHFEIGYAIRLKRSPYEVVTPGVVLSEISQRAMDTMVPGGLILGLGISVGL
jgi:hypothetical protein